MRNGAAALIGLAASVGSLGVLTSSADARVIAYDNFAGTFNWETISTPCGPPPPGPQKYLDITLPPTQAGTVATPFSITMVSQCSGMPPAPKHFHGESGVLMARCAPQEYPATFLTGTFAVTIFPARAFAPTEMIGPNADWNSIAHYGTSSPFYGPKATLGVKLVSPEGVRYGWVYLERVGSYYEARTWGYETEFDTPIAAYGTPDADGVLNVPSEYSSIRQAINMVLPGQTIMVANGTYGDFVLDFSGKAVTLRSTGGPQACILTGGLGNRFIRFGSGESPNTVVDGFTIRDYRAWNGTGGAIVIDAGGSPTIRNCIFLNNTGLPVPPGTAGVGGAVYAAGGSPLIENCLFAANGAHQGAALANLGHARVVGCTFTFNVGTTMSLPAGVQTSIVFDTGAGTMSNCIVYGNSLAPGGSPVAGATGVTFSCVEGGYAGAGNISANPVFVSTSDFRLAPGSPCIDAGSNPAMPAGTTTDLGAQPRFRNDPATTDTGVGPPPIVDMGAYELQVPYAAADLNHDDRVNGIDLALLLGQWTGAATYSPCPRFAPADLNHDCEVNGLDLALLLGSWG